MNIEIKMTKNWTVETVGVGLYIKVFNFDVTELVFHAIYQEEHHTSNNKQDVIPAIGRWRPKTKPLSSVS